MYVTILQTTTDLTDEFVKHVVEVGDCKVFPGPVVQVSAHQGDVGHFLLSEGGECVRPLKLKPLTGVNILQREKKTLSADQLNTHSAWPCCKFRIVGWGKKKIKYKTRN